MNIPLSKLKLRELQKAIPDCKEITKAEVLVGDMLVYYIDNRGIHMIQYFKGKGWRRFLKEEVGKNDV